MADGFRIQDMIRPLAQAESALQQFFTAPFQQAGLSAPPPPPGPASVLAQVPLGAFPGLPSPAGLTPSPLAKKPAAETAAGAGPTIPGTSGLERRGL